MPEPSPSSVADDRAAAFGAQIEGKISGGILAQECFGQTAVDGNDMSRGFRELRSLGEPHYGFRAILRTNGRPW